jgi:peroxiredoxin
MKKIILLCLILPQLSFAMIGLKVGDSAPSLILKDTDGKSIDLSNKSKTTVAIFYRGAWCPYCLKQLKSVEADLVNQTKGKARIIAISVDQHKVAKKMKKKNNFSFSVVSDSKAKYLKAFKITNKLSDDLVAKYKTSYKIDVEGDSGETHHLVAHPGVFIIKNGKIIFADVHVNYKDRTENSKVLEAIK